MRPEDLSGPEQQLWNAFSNGEIVDLRDAHEGGGDAVRAEVISALLQGAVPAEPGHVPAVRLVGARITGTLNLEFSQVAWPVLLSECRLDEAPLMRGARTREICLTRCILPGLDADTAQVDGHLRLTGCRITGTVTLVRASVQGDLDFQDSRLTMPGGQAAAAVGARIGGDLLCARLAVEGRFRLSGASIEGEFDLEGASLRNPGGIALDAYHTRITEDLTFHPGFSAEGRIIISGAVIGAALGFLGARLHNPNDVAVEAVDITVARNADFGADCVVDGGIVLDGSRIGTVLSFRSSRLSNPRGRALSLARVEARELDLRTAAPAAGTVDLRGARIDVLTDDPDTWAADLRLADTTYGTLAAPLTGASRLAWLRRGTSGYVPQPYEQLAATYRTLGHEDEARTVLLAKQRHRRSTLPWYPRVWGYLQDAAVGYGYRPLRAGSWMLALLALGTVVFGLHRPQLLEAGKGPAFNPFFYTLDLLVPVISFGQEGAFAPTGVQQWLAYGLVAAGWVLATTVTAGISRTVIRQ